MTRDDPIEAWRCFVGIKPDNAAFDELIVKVRDNPENRNWADYWDDFHVRLRCRD